jgi:hypothetical protein
MQRLQLLFSLFLLLLSLNTLDAHPDQSGLEEHLLHDWKGQTVITRTTRKPARTAILIISAPILGNSPTANRWKLGKKVWEQYMNSHPNVDCYFVECIKPRLGEKEKVWLEGNTLYVGDWHYDENSWDRILHKTILAMEWLHPRYTHFIRTNLNIFMNLKNINEYMETHHESFFSTPLWESAWYTIGYSIMFTADVAAHMVKDYRKLESMQVELISPAHVDAGAITSLATGIWPYDKIHPFRCCPTLPFGIRQLMSPESFSATRLSQYGALLTSPITLEQAINYIEQASPFNMWYRIRDALNLRDLAQFYQYAMQKNYPELPQIDLVKFVESLENGGFSREKIDFAY